MSSVVTELHPQVIWKHFDALTQIPRPSTKEAAARKYVTDLADKLGLEHVQDKAGNLVVRKPADRAGRRPRWRRSKAISTWCARRTKVRRLTSILTRSRLSVARHWLYADGTTLGSDNGVGVATALGGHGKQRH